MPTRPVPLLLILAAIALPGGTRACSVCAGGDPLAAASEQPARAHALRAALEGEWLTVSSASEDTPGAETRLDQYTARVTGVYSPLTRLNLAVTVPVLAKRLRDESASGAHVHGANAHGDANGVGDVELGARWFVLDRTDFGAMRRYGVALTAGTSIPTGANDLTSGGVLLDEHAQLGTGGYGPYAGVFARVQGAVWSGSASLSGRVRTENDRGYRYGEALTWSTTGEWRPRSRFGASLGLDGRVAQRDRTDGGFAANTGGTVLLVAPGVHFDAGNGAWITLRAQLPVYTYLHGEQSVGPTVVAGVQYQIL